MTDKETPVDIWFGLPFPNAWQIQEIVNQLQEQLTDPAIQWTAPVDWHMTLIYAAGQPASAARALMDIEPPTCDRQLNFDRLEVWETSEGNALVMRFRDDPIEMEQIRELQGYLYLACMEHDIAVSEHSAPNAFNPHITLAYGVSAQPMNVKFGYGLFPADLALDASGEDIKTWPLWDVDEMKGLSVFKDADGARHMMLVTSNGYKDREGEYISQQALQEYVDAQWDGDRFKGSNVLLFWHQGPPIGDIIHADMAGPFLVEIAKERTSGLPLIQSYTKAIWNYIEEHPEERWGTSHGFGFAPHDRELSDDGPVYRHITKFESSALPLQWAANPLTFSGVIPMSKARDAKLDTIQPGLGERIRRALGMTKDELDAAGVQSKSFEAEMTRADVEDVLVAAVNRVLAEAQDHATKAADGEEPEPLNVRVIVKETLTDFLDVPTVSMEAAEAILAVEDAHEETDAVDLTDADATEPEQHVHEPVEPTANEKALQQSVAFNEQLMDDQAALLETQTQLVDALKGLADLPATVKALSDTVAEQAQQIKAMQAQFSQRPRASVSSETVADGDLAALVEKAAKDAEFDDFVPRKR